MMSSLSLYHHDSVMVSEVLSMLQPRSGELYVDATLGGGGHSEAILHASSPDGIVLGIDQDPAALKAAQNRLAQYGQRFRPVHGQFSNIDMLLQEQGFQQANGIIADLGVSSPQLDQAERGFSFQQAGPVDMRMNPLQEETALSLLQKISLDDLTLLLQTYGEERFAKRVATVLKQVFPTKNNAEDKKKGKVLGKSVWDTEKLSTEDLHEKSPDGPTMNTYQLAKLIATAIPFHEKGKHPATRTFLALRMAVNNELGQLEHFLQKAPFCLAPQGRLAILTFHSLEDRMVKQSFRSLQAENAFTLLTPKPISAQEEEVEKNPRSRSAHLRAILRASEKSSIPTPERTSQPHSLNQKGNS